MTMRHAIKGFSLFELLLVTVIIGAVINIGVYYFQERAFREGLDNTSVQMQLILNAAAAYYVDNTAWPPSLACLQGQSGCTKIYLGAPPHNPYNANFTTAAVYPFYVVSVTLPFVNAAQGAGAARVLAGKLPMATASGSTVTAYQNVPGQALNKAPSANFAGLYKHGGCIPVPRCPGTNMVPNVFLVPVSVSGLNEASPSTNIYPVSSFTAYVTGGANILAPDLCQNSTSMSTGTTTCTSAGSPAPTGYWRACLELITERGNVAQTNTGTGVNSWGKNVTMMAITRCAVPKEASGSDFSVFGN